MWMSQKSIYNQWYADENVNVVRVGLPWFILLAIDPSLGHLGSELESPNPQNSDSLSSF